MVVVKFIKPEYESMKHVADNMRQADVDEVWFSHHKSPIESLMSGWESPGYSVIVTINKEPCAMLGVAINGIITGIGTPWLLSTEKALKYKRCFLTLVPDVIDEMLSVCPTLCNFVHVENKVSIRWLKRIGFKFDEPKPYGIEKKMFHKFYIERV